MSHRARRSRGMSGVLVATLLLSAAPAAAQLANGGFEQGEPGQAPPRWFMPGLCEQAGYTACLVAEGAVSGKLCAFVERGAKRLREGFGNLMQIVDAAPFRGKVVRYRAWVRVEAGAGPASSRLWLRVDRPGNAAGFFANMGDHPIVSEKWKAYEIAGPVARDARSIAVGFMCFGEGRAWIDDASLEVLVDTRDVTEPPAPLSERGLENLQAWARLMGIVRYFHPSDGVESANWGRLAVTGVRQVEDADGPLELARRLQRLLAPTAPAVRVFPTAAGKPEDPPRVTPPAGSEGLQLVQWRHCGLGLGDGEIYRSRRVRTAVHDAHVPVGKPDPGQPLRVELPGGVSADVLLALYADASGTLPPSAPGGSGRPADSWYSGDDRATRLADVMLAWNVYQHFYPYWDVVACDWQAVLRKSLVRAAEDAGAAAFLETLQRLVAAAHDGHGTVSSQSIMPSGTLHLAWDVVEGDLVVTALEEGAQNIAQGDVVLAIDGVPALKALAAQEELVSAATPQWRRFRALEQLRLGAAGKVRLSIENAAGEKSAVELERHPGLPPREPRPPEIHEVATGILYVDIDRVTDADLDAAMDRLEAARGLVFDLRGYPSGLSTKLIGHLTDETVRSPGWYVPVITRPDQEGMTFARSDWIVKPIAPRLKGKAAFVTDGRAISYAETWLGIISHYHLAEIVGQPTAGTNGNINPFELPGGYRVIFTGMKVLGQDGAVHHGVGIKPTVPVERTLEGIRAGRDELLERAIRVVGG